MENSLELARQGYNDRVMACCFTIESLLGNLIAGWLSLKPAPFVGRPRCCCCWPYS